MPEHIRKPNSLKPMQVLTVNYGHLLRNVNPFLVVAKGHTYLIKLQIYLSNMYDFLLPPDIKGLKLIYIDHNFVTSI